MLRQLNCAMKMATGLVFTACLPALVTTGTEPVRQEGEPAWAHGVVRLGDERNAIKSMPITDRPYRPLHFYGNTIRRMHYRGTPLPAPRDVVQAGAATILRK